MNTHQWYMMGLRSVNPLNTAVIAAYPLTANGVDIKNGYNATVGGAITYSSGAVFTNVAGSEISIPDNTVFSFGSNPFSISFFIKFSALGASQWIINKRTATTAGDEYQLTYSDGIFTMQFWNGSGGLLGASFSFTPTIGVEFHLTYCYDGTVLSIYKDAVSVYSNIIPLTMPNGTSPTKLGVASWAEGLHFTGTIRELYFFNKGLNITEVTELQTNNYPF